MYRYKYKSPTDNNQLPLKGPPGYPWSKAREEKKIKVRLHPGHTGECPNDIPPEILQGGDKPGIEIHSHYYS
jgi:hypothetical protein